MSWGLRDSESMSYKTKLVKEFCRTVFLDPDGAAGAAQTAVPDDKTVGARGVRTHGIRVR